MTTLPPAIILPFSELSKEDQLSFVLELQQNRRILQLSAFTKKKTKQKTEKTSVQKRKKKKTFSFSDPNCQALFDMLPQDFKNALLK